ncbi:MAG: hypothetical protein M1827_000442 [Pycnora praestabilis]|nr:MAG: hypothetical protein M1827_000442 [Pycnora praestabilis]
MRIPDARDVNFDIDTYLNRFVPRSRLNFLPWPISRFLGYRNTPQRKEIGNVVVWGWSFLGAFCGIALIEGVVQSSPLLQAHHPPIIIGSIGAAAILEYNTIESPLAQPRNSVLGQVIATVIGVGITRLFQLSPRFEELRWLAGALSVGTASACMGLTKTTHPPAGATALLAAVNPEITDLGWFLVPLILISSLLMLASALVINNIQRQFPAYWWTPADLSSRKPHDIETASQARQPQLVEKSTHEHDSTIGEENRIVITGDRIIVPDWMYLAGMEKGMLEILKNRMHQSQQPENDLAVTRTMDSDHTEVDDINYSPGQSCPPFEYDRTIGS